MAWATLYAIVRGLLYIGLLALVGCQTLRQLVVQALDASAPTAQIISRTLRFAQRAALAVVILILLRGAFQIHTFVDPGSSVTTELVRAVVLQSAWGHSWLLELAAATILLIVLWLRGFDATVAGIDIVLVLVVLWGQSGTGHAAGDNWHGPWGRVLDSLHLVGGGLWLGTLAVMMLAALPILRRGDSIQSTARVVHRFSIAARTGAALLVGSGVIAAVVYAGSIGRLVGSTWGQLLIAKLVMLAGVFALGWYNWRVVTPALAGHQRDAPDRLRRAIRLELWLGTLILAITTMLVVSPLPGE